MFLGILLLYLKLKKKLNPISENLVYNHALYSILYGYFRVTFKVLNFIQWC